MHGQIRQSPDWRKGVILSWYHLTDDEADRLNAPNSSLLVHDDALYFQYVDDPAWLHVGFVPRPTTRFGWFLHHLVHGIAMRYPFWKVIGFALFESEEDSS